MSRAPGRSWRRSRETSGLPAVYLLKTLIPLFALLMALQGVAQAIRAAAVLHTPPVTPGLDPGVHSSCKMDCRVKPGNDGPMMLPNSSQS